MLLSQVIAARTFGCERPRTWDRVQLYRCKDQDKLQRFGGNDMEQKYELELEKLLVVVGETLNVRVSSNVLLEPGLP